MNTKSVSEPCKSNCWLSYYGNAVLRINPAYILEEVIFRIIPENSVLFSGCSFINRKGIIQIFFGKMKQIMFRIVWDGEYINKKNVQQSSKCSEYLEMERSLPI